eukprot:COSAG04_NODE_6351_length_1350_cov_0.798561_3_plen_26_part_01
MFVTFVPADRAVLEPHLQLTIVVPWH